MSTALWVIPLLAVVAILAGTRGYKRGHEDGMFEGIASVPPQIMWASSSPVWNATDPGAFSYPTMAASYLLDEDGNIITSADRYLEPEAPDSR